jgi:xanthine dehydrogenase accessory factor
MEVSLVEQSRSILKPPAAAGSVNSSVQEQVHRKDVPNSSGMICSGKQTVIFRSLAPENAVTVDSIIEALTNRIPSFLTMTPGRFYLKPTGGTGSADFNFERLSDTDFEYTERLGHKNDLYIVGGGHCALALSELMSKMDFHISIFDDRPDLNTVEKNRFAHKIEIIDRYEQIAGLIEEGPNIFVVVMTLGYKSDAVVMRQLIDKDFKYLGVLGSKSKMAALMKELKGEGFPADRLSRIRTPIGLPINSRTPEEIAVSIAAEIIGVKNGPN